MDANKGIRPMKDGQMKTLNVFNDKINSVTH